MKLSFADHVDILGTKYSILVKNKDEHAGFKGHPGALGFTDMYNKEIVIKDCLSAENVTENEKPRIFLLMQKTMRHEIAHAFLHESGLDHNASASPRWAMNEETIDWISLQGPKLIRAWADAEAL